MDLDKTWPYLVGGGLVLLLLILGRSGGPSAGASTLTAIPTSTGAGDALAMQKEQDRTALLGTVVNAATALQGAVNGYRGQVLVTEAQFAGESALATINSRSQQAIARIGADRDVAIVDKSVTGAVTMNEANADRDITIGKANARAATTGAIVNGISNTVSDLVSKLNPFNWF